MAHCPLCNLWASDSRSFEPCLVWHTGHKGHAQSPQEVGKLANNYIRLYTAPGLLLLAYTLSTLHSTKPVSCCCVSNTVQQLLSPRWLLIKCFCLLLVSASSIPSLRPWKVSPLWCVHFTLNLLWHMCPGHFACLHQTCFTSARLGLCRAVR